MGELLRVPRGPRDFRIFHKSQDQTQVFGDKESKLIIAGNSLLRDFSGREGDVPYQVVWRPGLMLNLSEMY